MSARPAALQVRREEGASLIDRAPIDLETGAYTPQRFEQLLAEAVHLARKGAGPLAVLYIDVDSALELADLHGIPELTAALSDITQLLARELNGQVPIGRMGDDALAAFTLGMDVRELTDRTERFRRSVSSRQATPRVTVSVGIAQLRQDEAWGNVYEAAEEACSHAKIGGRNLVVRR